MQSADSVDGLAADAVAEWRDLFDGAMVAGTVLFGAVFAVAGGGGVELLDFSSINKVLASLSTCWQTVGMKINALGQIVLADISGQRFGNVVVLPEHQKTSNGGTKWLVECQCPLKTRWWAWAEIIKRQPNICCKECRKAVQARNQTKHGGRHTRLYGVWKGMLERCNNPKQKAFHNYGGRGIAICERWKDFVNFREDMKAGYASSLSIDRKDNNGNYSCGKCDECLQNGWPMNCKWTTPAGQANNRRVNKSLTAFGKTMTYSQWGRELGLDKTTIRKRVLKGWPDERCLSKEDFRSVKNNI